MGRRNVQWLLGELPRLVEIGTLSPEAAEKLRRHYGDRAADGRGWAVNLFAVLGSVLIGGGLILLLAHNWDQLSRSVRTVVSLAPLVAGQALAAWALWRGKTSVAWREGVGVFWALSIGASIALVGQTYHLPADLESFMLAWALLTLPAVYLLRSSLAVSIYLACSLYWACADDLNGIRVWLLILLAVPHLVRLVLHRRLGEPSGGAWETLSAWAIAIAVAFATTRVLVEEFFDGAGIVTLAGLFVAFYLLGRDPDLGTDDRWRSAFRRAGALGAVGFAWLLTFDWPWGEVAAAGSLSFKNLHGEEWLALAMAAFFPAAALVLCWLRFSSANLIERVIGGFLFVAAAGWIATLVRESTGPAIVLLNLYLFGLGIVLTLGGARARDRSRANWGMAVLSALILTRFFDEGLSFVLRGLAFIAVGVGFLVLNFSLSRGRRSER